MATPGQALKEMHTRSLIQQLEKQERALESNPHKADVLRPSIEAIRAELKRRGEI